MKVIFNLASLRKSRKLKQTELSKMTGISQKALSELETGKSKGVSFSTLSSLCEALEVSPNELFEVVTESAAIGLTLLEKQSCSFCGKLEKEVDVLIVGKSLNDKPTAQICSDCVAQCNKLIKENPA